MNPVELYRSRTSAGTLFRLFVNVAGIVIFLYMFISFEKSIEPKATDPYQSVDSAN